MTGASRPSPASLWLSTSPAGRGVNLGALTLAFRIGAHQAVTQPLAIIGQLVILTALLVSYGAVLKAVPQADLNRLHLTASQLVWYLALTETVMMVGVSHFRQVQSDLRSGMVNIWLLRPVEFWPLLLAEWAGQELPRLVPVGAFGFTLGWLITGRCAFGTEGLLLLVPTLVASTMIILCWCLLIGLSSVWLSDNRPVFWLYQKLLFLLGALLWPLAFYPHWLHVLAWLTPFPAIVATPGSLALDQSTLIRFSHSGVQLVWLSTYVLLCAKMSKAARRRLTS